MRSATSCLLASRERWSAKSSSRLLMQLNTRRELAKSFTEVTYKRFPPVKPEWRYWKSTTLLMSYTKRATERTPLECPVTQRSETAGKIQARDAQVGIGLRIARISDMD